VEILHTYTQAMDVFGTTLIAIVLALFFGLLAWSYFDDKALVRGTICGTISALSVIFAIAVGHAYFTGSLDETYHEVIITDMSAFDTSKYEIVEQRGKIFVVKEIGQ
jgi:Trk-type K+ transport system membrane component